MASEATGAFLSTAGEGLQKLGQTYMGIKRLEFEDRAERYKQDRLESFDLMKLQIGDQMAQQRIRLTGEQARETAQFDIKERARVRVGTATKVRVKEMDKHGINVVAEYDITIQDRTDVDTGERTWWKFDPTGEPPVWTQINDAERKKITDDSIGDGDPGKGGADTGDDVGKTLAQRIEAYAADYNTTIADAWQAFYVAKTENQQFPSITLDMLNELKAQYEEDGSWEQKVSLGPLPQPEMEEDTGGVEEGWLSIATGAIFFGGKKALSFIKWAKPWGFWKRNAVGAIVAGAFNLGGREWLDRNGISEEDLPAYWDDEMDNYWESMMDDMNASDTAQHLQMMLSMPGLELGQREAIMRAVNRRGLLEEGETIDQWVGRVSVPEVPEPMPLETESVETATIEKAGKAPVTEGGTNCQGFAMSTDGRKAQKEWMGANGGTRKQAYDAIIAQCEEFNR